MKITIADDSFPFDGTTPLCQPLGGMQRAVCGLAAALAGRGHAVTVFAPAMPGTDPKAVSTVSGVTWRALPRNWDSRPEKPVAATDALIAVRKPALLGLAAEAGHRVLWPMAAPDTLIYPGNRLYLDKYDPAIAWIGLTQRGSAYRQGGAVVAPGQGTVFRPASAAEKQAASAEPGCAPVAVVTTHPLNGLDWLLDLWAGLIHRDAPTAELHVYSALLAGGEAGEPLPSALDGLARKVAALSHKGVKVRAPLPEAGMAEVYRSAAVHLYPGHGADMACWTLGDSQACGLPAVARPLGAVHERLVNGETGYIVPDGAAFANVTRQLLLDENIRQGLAEAAAEPARRRSWDTVARDFELLMS